MLFILKDFLCFLGLLIFILICVAYLTLAERKLMGSVQQRIGPNSIGFFGLLQPISDGLKLLIKETIIPKNSFTFSFIFAPIFSFLLSLFCWCFIPFSYNSWFLNFDLIFLFVFFVSSLSVYGILLSGWSSSSKYAFFGCIRSVCQMISYEISFSLLLISIFVCVGCLNFIKIVEFQNNIYFVLAFFPIFIMFFISVLAETNRAPFDLPEAESELVSGFNVEYSSIGFAFFFLAEYSFIIFVCSLSVLLFFGGWISFVFNFLFNSHFLFSLKISFLLFLFIWIRSSFPRYRIDNLMRICWKVFLPLSFSFVLFIINILFIFNGIY